MNSFVEDLKTFYLKTGEKIFKRNFDSASRLVHEANRVVVFASGYVQANVLQELKCLFFYDYVFFCEIPAREEFYSVFETATKDDLFIVISLSGETPIVVKVACELQLRDIPLIFIIKLHETRSRAFRLAISVARPTLKKPRAVCASACHGRRP